MQKLIDQYMEYYNKVRIHGLIGYLCPDEYFEISNKTKRRSK